MSDTLTLGIAVDAAPAETGAGKVTAAYRAIEQRADAMANAVSRADAAMNRLGSGSAFDRVTRQIAGGASGVDAMAAAMERAERVEKAMQQAMSSMADASAKQTAAINTMNAALEKLLNTRKNFNEVPKPKPAVDETEAQALDRITQRMQAAKAARDAQTQATTQQKAAQDALNASISAGAGGQVSNAGLLATAKTAQDATVSVEKLTKARIDDEAASAALVRSADTLVGKYAPMIKAQQQLAAEKAAFLTLQKEGTLTAEQEAVVLAGLAEKTSALAKASQDASRVLVKGNGDVVASLAAVEAGTIAMQSAIQAAAVTGKASFGELIQAAQALGRAQAEIVALTGTQATINKAVGVKSGSAIGQDERAEYEQFWAGVADTVQKRATELAAHAQNAVNAATGVQYWGPVSSEARSEYEQFWAGIDQSMQAREAELAGRAQRVVNAATGVQFWGPVSAEARSEYEQFWAGIAQSMQKREVELAGRAQRVVNAATGVQYWGPLSQEVVDDYEKLWADLLKEQDGASSKLVGKYAPLMQAQRQLAADREALTKLQNEGKISAEEEAAVLSGLEGKQRSLDAMQKTLGGSTKANAQHFQSLKYQINDVVSGLIMGQPPMMIMVQQGGQIVQALQGMDISLRTVRPATLALAGGIAAVAVATIAGLVAWGRYTASVNEVGQAIRLTGNAVGMSRDQAVAFSDAVAEASGVSSSFARSSVAAYTSLGGISQSVMGGLIGITKDYAAVTGTSADEAQKALGALFKDPVKGAEELASKIGLLSGAQLDYIRRLSESGQKTQAQAILVEALGQRIKGAAEETSIWARGWEAVTRGASNAADAIGRALERAFNGPTLEQRLDTARSALAAIQKDATSPGAAGGVASVGVIGGNTGGSRERAEHQKSIEQAQAVIDAIQEQILERNRLAATQARDAQNNAASRAALEVSVRYNDLGASIRKANADLETLQKGLGTNMGEAAAQGGKTVEALKNQIADLTKVQASGLDLSTYKAQEAAKAEMQAAGMVGPAREKFLAQKRAEIEAFGTATTAAQRNAQVQTAVTQVTAGQTAAVAQQTAQYSVQTQGLLGVADAYRVSAAAGVEAAARAQAMTDALSSGADVATRTRELVIQGAAQQAASISQTIDGMKLEAEWTEKVATATKDGLGARDEMQRKMEVAKATSQLLAYAQAAEAQGDADLAKRLRDLAGSYDAASKAAAQARQFSAGADAIRSSKQDLEYAQKELALMGQVEPYRERALKSLQIQRQAMDLFKDTSTEALRQQKADWIALQEQIADTQAITSFKQAIESTAKDIARDWTETLYDAIILHDKQTSIVDAFKALGKRIALALLETNIVLPITTQIVGAMPSLFGIQGPALSGGHTYTAANGSGAGGFSLPSLPSLDSLFSPSTAPMSSVGSYLFGQPMGPGQYGPPMPGLLGNGGTFMGFDVSGMQFGGGLPGFAGNLAGNFLFPKWGKGSPESQIYANIGGTIGGTIGSIGGPIGSIIGSFLGNKLGGMFGPNKSTEYGGAYVETDAKGKVVRTGSGADSTAADKLSGIERTVKASTDALAAMTKSAGLTMSGNVLLASATENGKFSTKLSGWSGPVVSTSEDPAVIAAEALRYLAKNSGAAGPMLTGNADVLTALKNSTTTDGNELVQQLQFARDLQDTIKAMSGLYGLEDAARKEAKAGVDQLVESLKTQASTTEELFGKTSTRYAELTVAQTAYVDSLVKGVDATKARTAGEIDRAKVNAQWAGEAPAMKEALDAVGNSSEETARKLKEGLGNALGELSRRATADYVAMMNVALGRGYLNDISGITANQDTIRRNLIASGGYDAQQAADMAAALVTRQVESVLKGLSVEDLTIAAGSLTSWMGDLAKSMLTAGGAAGELTQAQSAVRDFQRSIFSERVGLLKEESSRLGQVKSQWQGVADTMANYKKSLLLGDYSTLDPAARLAEAKKQFDDLVGKAVGGDVTAAGQVQAAGEAYLKANKDYWASANPAAFQEVQDGLDRVARAAGSQVSAADRQLAEAQKQTALLERQINILSAQMQPEAVQMAALRDIVSNASAYSVGRNEGGLDLSAQMPGFSGLSIGQYQAIGRLTGYTGEYGKGGYNDFLAASPEALAARDKLIGWAQLLGQGKTIPGFATGTQSAPSGWAWVGEQGPELMRLGGGETIMPHDVSMRFSAANDRWGGNVAEYRRPATQAVNFDTRGIEKRLDDMIDLHKATVYELAETKSVNKRQAAEIAKLRAEAADRDSMQPRRTGTYAGR